MLQPHTFRVLKTQQLLALGVAGLLLLVLSVSFLASKNQTKDPKITLFSEPRKIAPFTLGNPVFSEKNLAHHWTLLFFGFTHCSEICPATLTEVKEAYSHLHPHYPGLQVVFVSIDPERDPMAELKRYTASFNKDFIGLRGTEGQLEKLKRQFGVFSEQDARSLQFSHTSSVFLLNPQGQWLAVFPYGLRSQQIQDHFKTIVENTAHA